MFQKKVTNDRLKNGKKDFTLFYVGSFVIRFEYFSTQNASRQKALSTLYNETRIVIS